MRLLKDREVPMPGIFKDLQSRNRFLHFKGASQPSHKCDFPCLMVFISPSCRNDTF